jgi:hypothetical protein
MRPDNNVAAAARLALGVKGHMPDNEARAALESLPGAKVVRRVLALLCDNTDEEEEQDNNNKEEQGNNNGKTGLSSPGTMTPRTTRPRTGPLSSGG